MLKQLAMVRRVVGDAVNHFNLADGWAIASHVALSILLALFPFLIFATALATFFGSDRFADDAVHIVFDIWPERIAGPIAREVETVLTVQRGDLLTVSALLAAFFASNGIEALRIALNRAYRASETRPWWLLRLHSIGFVLVGAIGFLATSILLVLAPLVYRLVLPFLPGLELFSVPLALARYGLALIVLLAGLLVVHKWLPCGDRPFAGLLPGIGLTLVAWIAGAAGFALYLESFATYVTTYAGLASIMIALVFLYMVSVIFIFGAELNAALLRHRRARSRTATREG